MRLKNKVLGHKGVTLVELVISMALIAIMSTSVVSLCIVLSNLSVSSSNVYDQIERLTLSREFIDKWFHSFDMEGTTYELDEKKLMVISTPADNKSYTISYSENNINIEYPASKTDPELTLSPLPTTFLLEGIKDLKFENIDDNNRIYKCIITYGEDEKTFSFILSRRSEK